MAWNGETEEQQRIIAELQVNSHFDAALEIERRIQFLTDYLTGTSMRSYVLGISGGIDSTTAGRLAQLAVERARNSGYECRFIAMRLPFGKQPDEDDAQKALAFIRPDEVITVNIQGAAQGMLRSLQEGNLLFADMPQQDFTYGNIKARERMVAQYAVAGACSGLVIGTDHAAEALMGFFTKHGDGACDLTPLTGLNKRRVRALAHALGAPDYLVFKLPTADLEELRPLLPDEEVYGISYDEIDDFLEGKPVSEKVYKTIMRFYLSSRHKRALPVSPGPRFI